MEWKKGQITEFEDGALFLVKLDPVRVFMEYHGNPVVVVSYGQKLETTYDPQRIDPDWVIAWCSFDLNLI